jgi:hypothetical protein
MAVLARVLIRSKSDEWHWKAMQMDPWFVLQSGSYGYYGSDDVPGLQQMHGHGHKSKYEAIVPTLKQAFLLAVPLNMEHADFLNLRNRQRFFLDIRKI